MIEAGFTLENGTGQLLFGQAGVGEDQHLKDRGGHAARPSKPAGRLATRIEEGRWERRVLTRSRVWRGGWSRPSGSRSVPWPPAAGLSLSRVHQLVAGADLDALDTALGELRAAGWPAPEHPDCGEDTDLDGRDLIADRLNDEVS